MMFKSMCLLFLTQIHDSSVDYRGVNYGYLLAVTRPSIAPILNPLITRRTSDS